MSKTQKAGSPNHPLERLGTDYNTGDPERGIKLPTSTIVKASSKACVDEIVTQAGSEWALPMKISGAFVIKSKDLAHYLSCPNRESLAVIDLRIQTDKSSAGSQIPGALHFPVTAEAVKFYTAGNDLDRIWGIAEPVLGLRNAYPFNEIRNAKAVVFHCDASSVRTPPMTSTYAQKVGTKLKQRVFLLEGGYGGGWLSLTPKDNQPAVPGWAIESWHGMALTETEWKATHGTPVGLGEEGELRKPGPNTQLSNPVLKDSTRHAA
ncbi:hypothetical protein MMC11_000973, partial [Xylographa trunciseda]|nr:hypothetical protein [Xylographa trunciseda]